MKNIVMATQQNRIKRFFNNWLQLRLNLFKNFSLLYADFIKQKFSHPDIYFAEKKLRKS